MNDSIKLGKEQMIRYKGHLSLCEIDFEGQRRIGGSSVRIVGAGGLGSPVALYLASAGVGRIGIVDPDSVGLSNLQRQIIHTTADLGRPKALSAAEKLRAINPDIEVEPLTVMLTEENAAEIIGGYDITVDCTDNLATRLLINDSCVRLGKSFVSGAVSRTSGQLFSHIPGSACYRCIFDPDGAEPGSDLPCATAGIMNSVVGVIGSLQATEVLKLIVGTGDALTNRILTFDALTMEFNSFCVNPVEGCICTLD